MKHLLDTKGRHIISVTPDTSVLDAIKLMADQAIGSLVVMEDEALCGIMSERVKDMVKDRPDDSFLEPDAIADVYYDLHNQHRSTWTQELDLRPWVEKF